MKKSKVILKKSFIILILFVMFFGNSSYATVSGEDAGNAIGWFARNYCSNHRDDSEYGTNSSKAYLLEDIDGKYQFNETGWISFVVHNSLKLGSATTYTVFVNLASSSGGNISLNNDFYYVKGGDDSNNVLKQEDVEKTVKIGDILVEKGGQRAGIYEGGNIVYCSKPANDKESCLKEISLYPDEKDTSRKVFKEYCAIVRIKESSANKLKTGNVTSLLEEDHIQEDKEYGKYYGTTQGAYVGSYTFNLFAWIFNAFLGFMEYLMGIIAFLFRAPFIGWANIIENMINDTINNISGIRTTDKPENSNQQTRTIEGDNPSDMDVYVSKRINIEDVIYNNVPILDIDLFDLNYSKYTSTGLITISSDSILLKMREIIAAWYYVMRNIAIIALLLLLVYLGIRLAIATTGEKKAEYKKMLFAWVTSFIVVFVIHYFMIIVIDVNSMLVDTFKQVNVANQEGAGGQGKSLYDTIRTRAYSLKLSEGMPATVLYMILIYFLIKFLYVYIKRYFIVNILALMGPFMAIKYGFESINKGGNNTGAIIAWMSDFALNVFLQSIHACIYAIFMNLAYEQAFKSVSGFVLALIILNYMFKAEELFRKIMKFNGRAGSMDNVTNNDSKEIREKGRYAFRVAAGMSMFLPMAGIGLIKNTSKVIGGIGQAGSDIVSVASGGKVNLAEMKKEKDEEDKKIKNEWLEKINNKIHDITGERSLRLDLNRLKETDPELYEKRKKMLDDHKKQKRELMKRSIKEGVKPITTIAKAMAGVPMLVVDPKYGFQTLISAGKDLNDMAHKNKHYGHMSKKEIRSRRGRVIAGATLTTAFWGYATTKNNYIGFKRDLDKIRKNQRKIQDLRTAESLKYEIETDLEKLDKENAGDSEYEKMKARAIESSLNSVISGRNLYGAITNYMKKNNLTKLTESDMEGLFRDFNIEGIDSEIAKLKIQDSTEIDRLKDKLDELKNELKDNIQNSNEIQEILKEINQTESIRNRLENKSKMYSKVGEAIKVSEKISDGMFKGNIINSTIEEYMETNGIESITDKDIPKIVEMYSEKAKSNMFVSKDSVSSDEANGGKKSSRKVEKEMSRKETVDKILDAIAEEPISEATKVKFTGQASFGQSEVKYEGLEDVAEKIKKLQALNEKSKNKYGSSIVDMDEFNAYKKKRKNR